ncbi:succinyl-diaminopimelate desuccinylase [SAR86 cluster bacterium SAR86E]|uniref:Succinyl-diaminopimelate desuccinylase n=1 Tax=SAR86 cluster bacterium SAR86E TaxID=1208365 RepID=K6GH18_9GAMM|nr:succinyl-diaminopimelate desuccinylase [SAR86 cluster bacterium SAR86E]
MSALELAQSLIKIKSISPEDGGCFDLIEAELTPLGFQIEKIPELNCETLLAKYGDSGKVFCYLGHTDVVPSGPEDEWTSPPFEANIVEGELIGRGAADMKGSVAVFIESVKKFLADHPNPNFQIWVMLTSNEEGEPTDGKINTLMDALTDQNQFIDYCLVGEASSSDKVGDVLRVGRRGSLSGKLKLIGKQGHVAYPHKVLSPILEVGPIINELNQMIWDEGNEHFDPTSFQISNIDSGTGATNVVPGHLNMLFNFRFSPESSQESLKERLVQVLEKSKCSFEIDWTLNAQPYLTKKTELLSIIQTALKKINGKEAIVDNGGGTSDGRWVSPSGSEVIELGPRNQTIHKIDEKISLADLILLQEIYQQILVETNDHAS